MNPDDVGIVGRRVQALGARFLIVGGAAVARAVPSETEDVDLMLAVSDFGRVIRSLAKDPTAYVEKVGAIAGGFLIAGDRRIEFDLLDPSAFSGERSAVEFFDYVFRYRSRAGPEGRYAAPPVVWYMRLMVPDWLTYVQKILRDLRAGAPWSWMEIVLDIARRFGTRADLVPRVAEAREDARMARLLPQARAR
ncbi:MAG: hypothetical protein L3J97_01300 [Thermoplasmata archaeon]|nr:hypothetical protein [Thermoplasmata archaeon]